MPSSLVFEPRAHGIRSTHENIPSLLRTPPAMPNPTQSPCRWRVLAGPTIAVPTTACAWICWRTPWLLAAALIAIACFLCALLFPRCWTPVQRGIDRFAHAVSVVVSFSLLAALFVTCFVPVRGLLLLLGRDPLRRGKAPDGASYWATLSPTPPGVERWRRQF